MMPEQILGTSSTTIDQHKYEMQMLPGTRSWKLMLRITKMLGPSLGKMLDTILSTIRKKKLAGAKLTGADVTQALMGMELSESFISEVVEALVDRMQESEVEFVIDELKSVCAADGTMLSGTHFDVHFTGRPWAIMKWIAWALQAQYSGSLRDSTNAASRAATSTSPQAAIPPA